MKKYLYTDFNFLDEQYKKYIYSNIHLILIKIYLTVLIIWLPVLNSLQKDLLRSMMNCLQFTVYIKNTYIYGEHWTNKRDMTKEGMKNWRRNSVWIRFVKSFFPFSLERWFFLDAGMNAAMPLSGLEEHFSEKRLHRSIYGWKSVRFSPRPLITRKILSQCIVARSNRIHV